MKRFWENGEIKWINGSLPPKKCKLIVLYEEEEAADVDFEALFAKLADLGTFDHIEDPVEWQGEIRKSWDRLPDLCSQTN